MNDAEIVDLTEAISKEDFLSCMCPFCECSMGNEDGDEAVAIVKAHGCIGLAHVTCISYEREALGT